MICITADLKNSDLLLLNTARKDLSYFLMKVSMCCFLFFSVQKEEIQGRLPEHDCSLDTKHYRPTRGLRVCYNSAIICTLDSIYCEYCYVMNIDPVFHVTE